MRQWVGCPVIQGPEEPTKVVIFVNRVDYDHIRLDLAQTTLLKRRPDRPSEAWPRWQKSTKVNTDDPVEMLYTCDSPNQKKHRRLFLPWSVHTIQLQEKTLG